MPVPLWLQTRHSSFTQLTSAPSFSLRRRMPATRTKSSIQFALTTFLLLTNLNIRLIGLTLNITKSPISSQKSVSWFTIWPTKSTPYVTYTLWCRILCAFWLSVNIFKLIMGLKIILNTKPFTGTANTVTPISLVVSWIITCRRQIVLLVTSF